MVLGKIIYNGKSIFAGITQSGNAVPAGKALREI